MLTLLVGAQAPIDYDMAATVAIGGTLLVLAAFLFGPHIPDVARAVSARLRRRPATTRRQRPARRQVATAGGAPAPSVRFGDLIAQATAATSAPPVQGTAAPAWTHQQPPDAAPSAYGVPAPEWLAHINQKPDKTPHLAVTGPSGSGKTTFVLAALSERPGEFVICTPKHQDDDPWGGFPAVRLDPRTMSFAPIDRAIRTVYAEMLRRNAQGARDTAWLTLVIDDYSTIIGKLPDQRDHVLDMITLGRSVRIRIVILATETNVEAWGWKGRGEARGNVLFIECEEDTHRAVMFRWGKERMQLDTRPVYQLAQQARIAEYAWAPPSSVLTVVDQQMSVEAPVRAPGIRATPGEIAAIREVKPEGKIYPAEGKIYPEGKTDLPASESDFTVYPEGQDLPEIAAIMAQIMEGKGKSEISKLRSNWQGKYYRRFGQLYEIAERAVRESAGTLDT